MLSAKFRLNVERALASLSAAAFLATLIWKDWIELVLGVDPDHGDGSLERVVVVCVTGGAAISLALLARRDRARINQLMVVTP